VNRLPDMDQRDRDHDIEPDDERFFQCSCGDVNCKGDGTNTANFNINGSWYAEECPMGRQLDQIAAGLNGAARADEDRDDVFTRR
jgi:hypothetical protein